MIDWTLILALLALSEVEGLLGGDEAPKAAAQAPEVDRPALVASEIKALRESNIFAPYGRKSFPSKSSKTTERKHEPAAVPKPKAPVVTGIFFDEKQKCFLVVVEDRNEGSLKQFKEPKFLKSGDEVGGLKVGTVTAEKAGFVKDGVSKELAVGDSLPSVEGKGAAPATDDPEAGPLETEEKVDIKPLDTEEKNKVLEKMRKERGKKNRPNNDE